MTSEKDLRKLIEKWRGDMVAAADREQQVRNRTLTECADELEAVLDDE